MTSFLFINELKIKKGSFWETKENRKKFFDKFGEREGFDPRDPKAWDHFDNRDIEDQVLFLKERKKEKKRKGRKEKEERKGKMNKNGRFIKGKYYYGKKEIFLT